MNIYIIGSSSFHIVDEEIKKICNNKKWENINFLNMSLEDLISEVSYGSLFNEEKIIVVRNASFLGNNDDVSLLEKYIASPNQLTTLILTTYEKIDERKKAVKDIKKAGNLIIVKNYTHREVIDNLISYAKSKKYVLSYDDANKIANDALNNYDVAINQLEKIFLYYIKPCTILHDDVVALTVATIEENNFKLIDAIMRDDIKISMKLIDDLKLKKAEPLAILSLLVREFRIMIKIKFLQGKNWPNQDIGKEIGLLDWQLDKYLKSSYQWKMDDLEAMMLKLADLDLKIKMGGIDKWLGLELLILSK